VNPRELVTPGNAQAFSALGRSEFRHMSKLDAAVWRAFLAVNPWPLESIAYDVTVGGKAAGALDDSEGMKPMWESLLKKRIDAVGIRREDAWTIEVKPTANMSALGQVLTYGFLWDRQPGQKRKARAVVVCARVDADVDSVFIDYGVSVVVVLREQDGGPKLLQVLGPLATLAPGL
jgi:hypothetical protein